MQPCVKDIALRAGVSHMTVSRVLHGSPLVTPETRERVLRVLRDLRYRPNAAARAIRNGRFLNVGLLLSTDRGRSNLPQTLLETLHDELAHAGYQLTVVRLPDEQLTAEGAVPRILREFSCDGLLINYTDRIPEPLVAMIQSHGAPSVWINVKQPFDAVYIDDEGGGRLATEHLLGLGHRRIFFIESVPSTHYSMPDRMAGYQSAMRSAGLAPYVVPCTWSGSQDILSRHQALVAMFQQRRPTAVVTYSHALSVWVAATEAGLRVPADLAIVVFEDERVTFGPYRITTVVTDRKTLGKEAVEMLLRKMRNPDPSPEPSRAVSCRLEVGDTSSALQY